MTVHKRRSPSSSRIAAFAYAWVASVYGVAPATAVERATVATVAAPTAATPTAATLCAVDSSDPAPSRWRAAGIEPAQPLADGDNVVLIGSSSMRGNFGRFLENQLQAHGLSTYRRGISSTGISRPDYFDWQGAVEELPITKATAAAFIYVGVNDPQGIWLRPEERSKGVSDPWVRWHLARWDEVYRGRVVALINAMCDRGARRVVVLLPADVRWSGLQQRLVRVRRQQILAARQSRCGSAVSTSGDDAMIHDSDERRQPRRMPDGYHLSTYGAAITWARIAPHVLRLLGWQPPNQASCR